MRYLAKIVRFLEKISGYQIFVYEKWIDLSKDESITLRVEIRTHDIAFWYTNNRTEEDSLIIISHDDLKKIYKEAKKLH